MNRSGNKVIVVNIKGGKVSRRIPEDNELGNSRFR